MAKKSKLIRHVLIPKHERLSAKDKKDLLEKYNVSLKQLPRVSKKDPAIQHLNVSEGDIIKITRDSKTAGTSIFYRVVSNV